MYQNRQGRFDLDDNEGRTYFTPKYNQNRNGNNRFGGNQNRRRNGFNRVGPDADSTWRNSILYFSLIMCQAIIIIDNRIITVLKTIIME